MSELPELTSYSEDELARASSEWPAISRYLELLKKPPHSFADHLRLRRHELWLRCALATYFERASAQDVCLFWSDAAESIIDEAWIQSGCDRLPVCLLALGKLGSRELNLSSDVDLIMVKNDSDQFDMRAFREFQSLLSEPTEFGFCLRVDFTLRPGGRLASAVPSVSEFEYYYGYQGETWERLAYVRMRILKGPKDIKEAIQVFTRKFSFRKHLDYTLFDDLKSLRSKIRSEKFEKRPGLFHLKLGEGGIRELELFVHALQVIHGGRNPALQTYSTTQAIEKIEEFKLLPAHECEFLKKAYWYLRTLENRLHAYEDQQNYLVEPAKTHPALPSDYGKTLSTTCLRVSQIVSSLLGEASDDLDFPDDLESQKSWLADKGFSAHSCNETWPELWSATALSLRSDKDEKARINFLRGFVTKLSETSIDKNLGLSLLLDFVRSVRAKASFFTLLNREPQVRDNLAILFSTSPYLGSLLASRPELIDEFIFQSKAPPSQDLDRLLDELAERRLLAELISANHFLSNRDLEKLCENLTNNADEISLLLLNRLKVEHGPSSLGLIAMGKWGGRELGFRSDLDFIFVTPTPPTPNDQKVAKRFISRVMEPHRGGSIYSIDMRLRPSGHAGPILVGQEDLRVYLSETAAPWERQAYLRARPLLELGFHPAQVAAENGLSETDRDELRKIRSQLFVHESKSDLDLKLTIGGLADIEFAAQIALLDRREFSLDPSTSGMIQYLESVDASWKKEGPRLRESYSYLRLIEQLFQLTTSQSGSKMRIKSSEFARLALVLSQDANQLEASIRSVFDRVSNCLRKVHVLDR